MTPVRQSIASAYAVWMRSRWEVLNEVVLMRDHSGFDGKNYNSPMMYSQVSHRFGAYRPYLRYQYLNVPAGDPLSGFKGRYDGPSVGVRYDFSDYAVFKVQYNLVRQTGAAAQNGVETQLAFTF